MEKEPKQEGAAEEQVKEKPSEPVSKDASTEAEKASEKVKIEDTAEYRTMQSLKDKADSRAIKAEKAVESMQNQLQEFRNQMEQQRLDDQRRQLDAVADDPDAQKKLLAKFDLDKAQREFDERMKREREGLDRAVTQIGELTEEYNLTAKDVREILSDARSPKEMELMAKLIAAEKAKVVETPKETKEEPKEGFEPDSGKSDAGGDSDEAFLKRWNAGDEPATKENLARAKKIIEKT